MTGQRGRLKKLEAQSQAEEDLQVIGFFDADPEAGLWRDVHNGRERPMTPEEVAHAREAKSGMLMLGPLPGRSKIIYGVSAREL